MRILADTNILISAMFYPGSKPSKALYHVTENHNLVLSDHNIAEFRRIARDKFSGKQADIDLFLMELPYELVLAPESPQKLIADPKDAPILNAAIIADVDIIISGDNHFLSLNLERPKTMKAVEYLKYIGAED
ncbi:MAG: putative toxin-antitoxin system toxin component, PIN family [Firmicutes bacterium]|nr:putative toxin-antitoxin system toxin component, PIN family [Bacillota bacterium]